MKTYQKHKITICYNLSKDLCFGGLKTHHKRTKGQGKHRQYLARIGNCEKKKKPSDRLHNRLQASHATEWNRTIDLHLTMVLLYRLSYSGYICAFAQSESNRRGFALQTLIHRLEAVLPTLPTELQWLIVKP